MHAWVEEAGLWHGRTGPAHCVTNHPPSLRLTISKIAPQRMALLQRNQRCMAGVVRSTVG